MNSDAGHCMLYITLGSRDEALKVARSLVSDRLVACANVLGEATSIFRWDGKLEESQETVLIAKTRRALADVALKRIEELHSYDVPCAVVYEMTGGLPKYLAWIDAETA